MSDEYPTDMTVLVTGGAGFIGSHIVDALHPTNEVRVLDNFSTGTRHNVPSGVTTIKGDIRDSNDLSRAMADVDIVFHEAAIVSVEQSVEQPRESHTINVDAAIDLFEEARRRDARVVAASSCAIYGEPESLPIDETARKTPASPYGVDKLALDHYAKLYYDLYGLETVALRYFNVYGPRQTSGAYSGVISAFRRQAEANEPLTVEGDGDQTRDFVHVNDIVQANLLAATTPHVGEAYNIGTENETSVRDLADIIREAADTDSDVVHTDPRPGDVRHSRADVSKAHNRLGYTPTLSLKGGLQTLFDG